MYKKFWNTFLFWTRLFCTATWFLQRKFNLKVTWLYERNLSSFLTPVIFPIVLNFLPPSNQSCHKKLIIGPWNQCDFMLFRSLDLIIFSDLRKRKPIPIIILLLYTFALREVETLPWVQFHKELFKLKLSIKGKDESCFHHVKILKIRPLLVRVRKRPFCWIFLSPFVIKKWSFLSFSQLIHYGF